jgi:hypothetical protein
MERDAYPRNFHNSAVMHMMRVLLIATAIGFVVGVFPAFAQGGGGCTDWCRAKFLQLALCSLTVGSLAVVGVTMPDEHGRLTEADNDLIQRWWSQHWTDDSVICPVCKKKTGRPPGISSTFRRTQQMPMQATSGLILTS